MKYPQLSLRETNAPYMEEMKTAAAEVIEGGWYIRGKYVSRLEEQLCAYLGCRYAVATGNGLDALRLMLRAYIEMGVMQPGDEVIVPSNTYVASVLAITDNGLVPVFVEPSIHTYNLDTSLVERAVTARTRAIMVVHLYGRVCWDECLKDVAARYGLKIVEDNAQAFGAVSPVAGLQGSFHTGALGNAAGLSFYPTKNLGALGDAGAVTTNDGELAHRLLAPRRHVPKQYFAQIKGKMTQEDAQKFRQGVEIGEKNPTLPAKLEILSVENGEEGWISCINLTIEEGKFHQIKRMVQAVGKEVIYLKRISMGPLYLDENLERGQCRPLTEKEIELLKKAATKS